MGVAAFRSWLATSPGGRNARHAQTALNDQRFSQAEPRGVIAGAIGLPKYNACDVSSHRLSRLMKISDFGYFIHPDDQRALEGTWQLTFPDNATRLSKAQQDLWFGLPESARQVRMATGLNKVGQRSALGNPLLWFTLRDYVDATLDAYPKKNPADILRGALGLVEFRVNEWLVLITFSGAAVQRAGHYRPVFCDSGGYRRFKVSRTAAGTHDDKWGCTAHLHHLRDKRQECDGLPKRVALRPTSDDFQSEKITFELLGQVSDNSEFHPATDNGYAEWLKTINQRRGTAYDH
jgi:hypothetical protein